jgi:hypothetical protein
MRLGELDIFLEEHQLGNPRLFAVEMAEVQQEAECIHLLEARMASAGIDFDDLSATEGRERQLHLNNIRHIIETSERRALIHA